MKIRNKIISVISAVCFLASVACYSAYAAELLKQPSKDEDYSYTEPVTPDPGYTEPVTPDPGYTEPVTPDPVYVDPEPVTPDPGYTESTYNEDPSYVDPGYEDPTYTSEGEYPATYSDVISEGNFPQPETPVYSMPAYTDNTAQYNQYIANQYQAQYDDNYIYVPEYEEPTQSLIPTESKVIDTDELTKDDWNSIMLDLSNGSLDGTEGAQTFNFIKENDEEGDTDMMWLVYLGTALILASILMVVFVIVTSTKASSKDQEYYYA